MLLCVPSPRWAGGNAVPAVWAPDVFSVTGALLSATIVAEIGINQKEEVIQAKLFQLENQSTEKLMFLIKFLSWK